MNKIWKKNCPKSGGEQVYCTKYRLKDAILKNPWCNLFLRYNEEKQNLYDVIVRKEG